MPKTMNDVAEQIWKALLGVSKDGNVGVITLEKVICKVAGADPRTVSKYRKFLAKEKIIRADADTGFITVKGEDRHG